MRVYLANPLGFSSGMKSYLDEVVAKLEGLGHEVYEPFRAHDFGPAIEAAYADGSNEAFAKLADTIAEANEAGIDSCDAVLGVLDGAQVDDGTAWELGYAVASKKVVYGLRTDFRNVGDFPGVPVNLQVLRRMVKVFRSISEINF